MTLKTYFNTLALAALLACSLAYSLAPAHAQLKSDWSRLRNVPTNNDLVNVRFLNNQFIAVGKNGTVLTSADGSNWKKAKTPELPADNSVTDVTYNGKTYLAVGSYAAPDKNIYGFVLQSKDGSDWQLVEQRANPTWNWLSGLIYTDRYVLVDGKGAIRTTTAPLNDPAQWLWAELPVKGWYQSVAHGEGKYVAVGGVWTGSAKGLIMVSSDAKEWDAPVAATGQELMGVAYAQGVFSAVGKSGEILNASSKDLETWTKPQSAPRYQLQSVATDGKQFVAVGEDNAIVVSRDGGKTWADKRSPALSAWLRGVAYGAGQFVAVGPGGVIVRVAQDKE